MGSFLLGHRYFFTVIDDHNYFGWIFLMKMKSKTYNLIQSFVMNFKTQFNTTIKTITYDNGPEFFQERFLLNSWEPSSDLLLV